MESGLPMPKVHVAPEHRVPLGNLNRTARVLHLEALHSASRRGPHPPRLSESPHVCYPLPRSLTNTPNLASPGPSKLTEVPAE